MKALLTTLALGLLALPLAAQDPDARLKELERKVDILSRELEAQKSGSAVPEAKEQGSHGLAPAASKVYDTKGGLSIGGYGEMLYENFDSKLQNGTYSPKDNRLDFVRQIIYLGYKFSDKIVFNTEIEFEHAKTGGSNPGEVAVEFAYLDFLLARAVNVRAGMLLVPMGFLNEMHEPPTYLGAKRPFVEQQIIPSTWRENGLGIHGELPANLSYRLYLLNGLDGSKFSKSGIRGARQNGANSVAESLAMVGRLDWNPMPGTTFGVSYYSGNSAQADNTKPITTRILDLHGEWRFRGVQVRGLYAQTTNSEDGLLAANATVKATGKRQFGGYLEGGYDVLSGRSAKQALIPFLRWERLNTQSEVVAGITPDRALDQTVLTYGVVYKPIPQVAFKADMQKIENRANTGRNQVNLGLGYYF
jgi:hypothetical protein